MQDIELYRQLKLIQSKKDDFAKYVLYGDKPRLLIDVESYILRRNIRIKQISESRQLVLPKIRIDQEDSNLVSSRSAHDLTRLMHQRKKRSMKFDSFLELKNIVKRSMIDDKSGKSKFFLTALSLENKINPYQKFKSIAHSVWIFLSFFKWIAKNANIELQWSWTYDPITYLYRNPFKENRSTAIDFALTQNSSSILECYSGWLKEDIRSLLRIHPSKRKDRDIDILMKYFSTMKSFRKYNAQSRREFLTRGEYNAWEKGRHIIKEGYPALALYFILDGEVAVTKMQEKQTTELSVSHENNDESVAHRFKRWDGNNSMRLTTLFSGDSFGEVAFTISNSKDQQTRQATVTTLKNTEFLLVEIHDATQIIKTHNDNSFDRKIDFISSLPLLKSLRVDARTLAYYCTFKSVSLNAPLLIEGENSPNMYFIISGECRLLKTVKIKKMKTGNLILETLEGKNLFSTQFQSGPDVLSPFVEYHLVVVGQLKKGDYFGEGYLSSNISQLTWLNGSIGHGNSRFSGNIKRSLTKVVTNNRTEIMCVPKAELHRFATEDTWELFLQKSKEIPKNLLYQSYEKVLKWAEIKAKTCKSLKSHYSTKHSDFI